MVRLESLAEVFAQVPDPRDPRGVRHPLSAILTLVFLGMLARIREMAVLQRWATVHWDVLREPLGFDRDEPPHATTISRTLAKCDLTSFTAELLTWVQQFVPDEPFAVAVDAKTSCQGIDTDGQPIQLVTVMVHQLKLVLAQWSVRGEKTNEPTVLRNHLSQLLADFPKLALLTGDAIYTQRPLASDLQAENCDYLLQIKANQPDILDAARNCLGQAHERDPLAKTIEKKGTPSIAADYGLTWRTSPMCVNS